VKKSKENKKRDKEKRIRKENKKRDKEKRIRKERIRKENKNIRIGCWNGRKDNKANFPFCGK
jgi:hypothetical protein